MDKKLFYTALRRKNSGLFKTRLSPAQVEGLEVILTEGEKRKLSLKHMSYVLATAYLEVGGKMQPIRESLNYSVAGLLSTFGRHRISASDAQRLGRKGKRPADQVAIANIIYGGTWGMANLGNMKPDDGWRYRGGGFPQITGRANFAKFGWENEPEKCLDLKASAEGMVEGMMKGLYTGKKLSDYTEYFSMRQVVNSFDRAELIAEYARSFEKVLKEAGWAEDVIVPRPESTKPVSAPKVVKPTSSNATGITALLAMAASAIAAYFSMGD